MNRKSLVVVLSGLALSGTAQAAPAYNGLLTFDSGAAVCGQIACANGQGIVQSYGDAAGVVDVSFIDVLHNGQPLLWWSASYNDLHGVAYADGGDGNGQSHARIEIKSLNGSAVTLNSMDFGAYPSATRNTHVNVTVIGGGASLFSYNGAIGVGATTHDSFAPAASSTTGLWIDWYDTAYNVGIDNVSFTVGSAIAPVPEPETYAMMLAGLGLMGLAARRRRQRIGV